MMDDFFLELQAAVHRGWHISFWVGWDGRCYCRIHEPDQLSKNGQAMLHEASGPNPFKAFEAVMQDRTDGR